MSRPARPYGCFNRPAPSTHVVVQDGWQKVAVLSPATGWKMDVSVRRDIMIPDPMAKDCQYSLTAADPRCEGCNHDQGQATPKETT